MGEGRERDREGCAAKGEEGICGTLLVWADPVEDRRGNRE